MALKPDRERVKLLLKDTITLLCKNGLEFKNTFAVDAVIGVTLDESDVFLVSMNEIVKSDRYQEPSTTNKDGDISSQGGLKERRRKRRRKHSDIKSEFAGGSVAGSESSDLDNADHHEPHPKRYELESKQEPLSDNDENDEDIVVIKEELDDNWHESVQQQSGSRAEAQSSMFYGEQGTSADMSSQNQNFDDMSLLSTPGKNSCWALVPGNQGSGHMESFRSGGSRSSVSDCIERHPGDLSQDSGPQQDLTEAGYVRSDTMVPLPAPTYGQYAGSQNVEYFTYKPPKGLGNKNSAKSTRTIQLGWLNYDPITDSFRQVREKTGGGSHRLVMPKETMKSDIVEAALKIFFPDGMSRKGPIDAFDVDIQDFQQNVMSSDTTLGEYCDIVSKKLRFYLTSKQKNLVPECPGNNDIFDHNTSPC